MKSLLASLLFFVSILSLGLAACRPEATAAPTLPPPAVSTAAPQTSLEPTAVPDATVEPSTPVSPATTAEPSTPTAVPAVSLITAAFVKEEQSVTGSFSLDPATGRLQLSDDFAIVPGPDLYVVLSGAADLTLDYRAFSQQVTANAKITLGPLAKINGAQTYVVPSETYLPDYKTVVIWCDSFSVAFAAALLNAP